MYEDVLLLIIIIGSICTVIAAVRYARILMVDAPNVAWLTQYDYAHRGLHGGDGVPENSLAAFQRAVREGCAIEMDIRLTRDGHLVVFHDGNLLRMTGLFEKVRRLGLAGLKELQLEGTDERIPTLREALLLVDGSVPILFELKSAGITGRLERKFYNEIKQYNGRFAVQSFSPWSLRWFRRNAPHIPRGQLAFDIRFCGASMCAWKMHFLRLLLQWQQHIELNYLCRPHFISYEYHGVDKKILRKLRQRGAPVLAWTVRDRERIAEIRRHADAVIFEEC
ncbi:MAG TPA: glycerophosphodiester phosphodiesterase [Clostridiales bacterium]|nr:glycerophosphodiester phosphodiesterase [Clostridiales bacterium]